MTNTYSTFAHLVLAIALSLLSTTLSAQVYQTTDQDGNPVFSDTPSAGASEVDIQTPNTANSVEPRPPVKQTTPTKERVTTAPKQAESEERYLINSDDSNRRPHNPAQHQPGNKPGRPKAQPIKTARPVNRR